MRTAVADTSIDTYRSLRREGGLTRQQSVVMAVIAVGCDYSLREIANLTNLDTSTVSGRVNELRTDGRLELAPARPCVHSGRTVHPVRRPASLSLDLDAIKASGLNSTAESVRLLAEHAEREHAEVIARLYRGESA